MFEGGTHTSLAPPFDFIAQTFVPLLQRMGAHVQVQLDRAGFYPAGGGRFEAQVRGGAKLEPLELTARGELRQIKIKAVVSQLPERIARRELTVLSHALADQQFEVEAACIDSPGPGNVASVTLRSDALTETLSAFGEIGVRAEIVASRLAGEVRRYLHSSAPVGEHLADQLLIPLALAGGRVFCTTKPSEHTRTNAQVVAMFLPVEIDLTEDAPNLWKVRVSPRASGQHP